MKKRIIQSILLAFVTYSLAACQTSISFTGASESSKGNSSSAVSSSHHTHTPGKAVEENRVAASCSEDGHYDLVVYCTECQQEISREQQTITATGHDLIHHDAKEASCTEFGWNAYDTCSKCDYSTYQKIPATGHVNLATREENRIEPDCFNDGSCDVITYCLEDNEIVSNVHRVIASKGHSLVHHAAKTATCTTVGWKEYDECSRCGYTTYEEIPATGHVHTATKQENYVKETCTEDGSYDLVTYCTDDNYVLSREKITVSALGHDLIHHEAKEPTLLEIGWNAYDTCKRCNYSTYVEIPRTGPHYTANKASKTYKNYINNSVYELSSTPSSGDVKLLVIPVWFTDSNNYISTSKKESLRSDIQTAYFGSNQETGWRSVKTYYEEESHGALTITGTVSDWYTDTLSSSDYGPENTGEDNTIGLVTTVVDWYFTKHTDENRQEYDSDGDGYLDGVMLIYGAPDYGAANRSSSTWGNLWAYCFWVQNPAQKSLKNPGPNAFFWASYDFMFDGSHAYQHTSKSYYGLGDNNNGVNVDAHTYIHEMGHMYGLEDYYDYSKKQYSPAGGFSMQDENVGGHDPYSSFALGWGKAYVPTETSVIELKPFSQTGEMIILSPSWDSINSPFDEYIIVEYYTPDCLNELDAYHQYKGYYPSGSYYEGIRVWHVDARLVYYTGSFSASNIVNNPDINLGYGVTHAMDNTYDDGSTKTRTRISCLGTSYADYNILQMIRNDEKATYHPTDMFDYTDLFFEDETFTMEKFSKQFVKGTKLNNGNDLGFSFTVKEFDDEKATIIIEKL